MADNLPLNFPVPSSPNLASYDFYDLATGTGYKTFYGLDVQSGAFATELILSPNVYYADVGFSAATASSQVRDFDLTFEVPTTLEGDCIVNVPVYMVGGGHLLECAVSLNHVSVGGTETILGTLAQNNKTLVAGTSYVYSNVVTIPNTRFTVGEKFRVSVYLQSPGGGETTYILYDPMGRSDLIPGITTTASQLKVNVPIKL